MYACLFYPCLLTEINDQESCMVWYQNSQSKIYFVKVCWAENWGKFRQRLTFPAFSLPHHYGGKVYCAKKATDAFFLSISFSPVFFWRHQQLWEHSIQGGFFNWPSPISVPKRKLLSSQSWPFLVTGFSGTAAVVGWLAVFFLVLKLGGWGWGAVKKTTLYMLMYSFLSPNIETLWWTESLNWVAFLANLDRKMYSHSAPKRGVAERK